MRSRRQSVSRTRARAIRALLQASREDGGQQHTASGPLSRPRCSMRMCQRVARGSAYPHKFYWLCATCLGAPGVDDDHAKPGGTWPAVCPAVPPLRVRLDRLQRLQRLLGLLLRDAHLFPRRVRLLGRLRVCSSVTAAPPTRSSTFARWSPSCCHFDLLLAAVGQMLGAMPSRRDAGHHALTHRLEKARRWAWRRWLLTAE